MTNNRLIDPADVTYLTSQVCEDTGNVDELKLNSLGLESGSFMDSSYPLTDTEACFIGEDVVEIGGHLALTGYSVLIGNRKYLAPTIEIDYTSDDDCAFNFTFGEAKAANKKLRDTVGRLAEITNGYFCWNAEPGIEFKEGGGKFVTEIFIPFEYAQERTNSFEQWKDHLAMLASEAEAA